MDLGDFAEVLAVNHGWMKTKLALRLAITSLRNRHRRCGSIRESLLGQRQHVITTGVENSTLVERQRLQTSGVLGMGHLQRLGLTVGYEGTLIFRAKFASATAQLLSS
jgi:hypothetical protein